MKIQKNFIFTFEFVSLIINIGIMNEKTIMTMKSNNEVVFPYSYIQRKLVFILNCSTNFENPKFRTKNNELSIEYFFKLFNLLL